MTKEIDWSKAPEGTNGAMYANFKHTEGGFGHVEFIPGQGLREEYDEAPDAWLYHAKPKSWDGKGKPPVGIEIEMKYKAATAEWSRPDFHAVTLAWVGSETFVTSDEKFGSLSDVLFRPVRTAEQIAYDEREAGITAIAVLMDRNQNSENIRARCAILWDAGYRKQEQSK